MKKITSIGLLVGSLAVGIIIGGWCGAAWSAHALSRMALANPEVDDAFLASEYDEWAAQLRIGQVNTTITNLEDAANAQVAAIATWDEVAPPDRQMREARDRFLHATKTYEESYPATGGEAYAIKALLSTVAGRNLQSTCKDAICQVDDMRLAKLRATTNSP